MTKPTLDVLAFLRTSLTSLALRLFRSCISVEVPWGIGILTCLTFGRAVFRAFDAAAFLAIGIPLVQITQLRNSPSRYIAIVRLD
jgi:hypothetical protein